MEFYTNPQYSLWYTPTKVVAMASCGSFLVDEKFLEETQELRSKTPTMWRILDGWGMEQALFSLLVELQYNNPAEDYTPLEDILVRLNYI